MKRNLSLAICLYVLVVGVHTGFCEEAQWSDGTPVVRFDQRSDAPMTSVADWSGLAERRWAGPTIWTNRLQDWRVYDGSLCCEPVKDFPCRTAHLLTYDLGDNPDSFRMEVVVGLSPTSVRAGFAGFLIGAGEGKLDYRGASLVHHFPGKGGGILTVAAFSSDGGLAFRDMSASDVYPTMNTGAMKAIDWLTQRARLNLEGIPQPDGNFNLRLSGWSDPEGSLLGALELRDVPTSRLKGNVALVAHPDDQDVVAMFKDFKVGGERLQAHPERTFGPIAGTLYSLSGGVLKLSAQFVHLGEAVLKPSDKVDGRPRMTARLEARPLDDERAEWQPVADALAISPPDYLVLFQVDGWDMSRDWRTRVLFLDQRGEEYAYETIVRRDPEDKNIVSVAGFTGMGGMGRMASGPGESPAPGNIIVGRWTPANVWAPHAETVRSVLNQNVDLLFFTGDQIYENKPSGADASRTPYDDYLYKWLLWHWSFRDLTNHLPAICQPDDHDVYQGNLWGWSGHLNVTGFNGDGGYMRSPYFVNMVHRTQTSQNPGPYDPTPCENGISNHYGSFTYGGIGIAVLEDRKFKTPKSVEDPTQQSLLGDTQEAFLREWGEDWTGQKLKLVVSQTVYASMHVDFQGQMTEDFDTAGFPKNCRNRAVALFRRCGAVVLCGDQHLGTFSRLGIESPSDGVYQFCVPAMGNIFWRWFYPATPGADRGAGEPEYLGEFLDGFKNKFRMIAVANPERPELLPKKLRTRPQIPEAEAVEGKGDVKRVCQGDGYGVVRFDKSLRTVSFECWPYDKDPGNGAQFNGWPITVPFEDLDGSKPVAWLPDLMISNASDPVIQILNEETNEIVKITRAHDGYYRPGVFDKGARYTLRVGEPGSKTRWWEVTNLKPSEKPARKTLKVRLMSEE